MQPELAIADRLLAMTLALERALGNGDLTEANALLMARSRIVSQVVALSPSPELEARLAKVKAVEDRLTNALGTTKAAIAVQLNALDQGRKAAAQYHR